MIGKLERVPLREVWKHEALHFTRWLSRLLPTPVQGGVLRGQGGDRR